jgi:hypothetical protein
MKRKILFIFLLTAFMLLSFVSAVETEITVETLPEHNVEIRALQPDEVYNLIESLYTKSDTEGHASVILSTDVSQFELAVWIKQNNDLIKHERFEEEFSAGEPIKLELYPDWYLKQKEIEKEFLARSSNNSEIEEVSAEAESEEIEEAEETNVSEEKPNNFNLAGLAVFGEEGFLSKKTLYYIIGIVALLGIAFLGTSQMMKMRREGKLLFKRKNAGDDSDFNKQLEDAEKRIKEAQEEIARIKSKSSVSEKEKKIMEAKKKIIEDQKELMRLRSED